MSLYIRKRLPQPNARIETFAPVRPKVRVGRALFSDCALPISFSSKRLVPAAAPSPTFSRNSRREISLLMMGLLSRYAASYPSPNEIRTRTTRHGSTPDEDGL